MLKNTLQIRLTILLVAFSFLAALGIGSVSSYISATATKENALNSNQTITTQIANEIERFVNNDQTLLETLALSPTAYSMDAAKFREMIITAQKKNPEFETIYVMNQSGMQIAKTTNSALNNKADKDYFKNAMQGKTYLTDSYISQLTNAPTVTISAPIKDASGKTIGVLAGDVSLKVISELAGKIAIGKTGYVDVVDQKGVLLAHRDEEKVKKQASIAQEKYIQVVINDGKSGTMEGASSVGVASLIAYAPVASYKWGVITYLPKSEINSVVQHSILVMAILVLFVLLIAAATAMFAAKGLARPLHQLVAGAGAIAGGDLTRKIEVSGVEEVNELSRSLDRMREDLRSIIQGIMVSSDQVSAASEELTASAEQSAQATGLVANTIGELAEGADKQVGSIEKASAVVEQMSAGIEEVSANAITMTSIAEQASESASGGGKSVEAVMSQMGTIEKTVTTSAQAVAQLGERSQMIGQIVETISGIAGQTNLLALNAAIEAARAGEQGRGFAVVAEEVRKLAEQSQEAAKQIAALIIEVQSETEKAVVAMNNGTREVKIGSEVVHTAGQAFGEIIGFVERVSGQVKGISAAMQQMASESELIVDSVHDIDTISKAAAGHTQTVSAATEEQAASMQEIASASQALVKMAEELQGAVKRFKL
ncbi:methyl-accepting chemotaxis protein [Azotosporobacter soli]|uniref:methyl-accepting chemotaxis protein n=1 Tax=Azotosporobacter soli TaxID=3055040 RepID=UPI0031FF3F35